MARSSLISVLLFSTGVVCGYVVAKNYSSPEHAERPAADSPTASVLTSKTELSSSAPHLDPLGDSKTGTTTQSGSDGDVDSAMISAARDPDLHRRSYKLFEIAAGMDADGAANATKHAESLSAADRNTIQPILLARWLDLDSSAALSWVAALPPGSHRDSLLKQTFSSLGSKNPALALQLLDGLKEGSRATNSYRQELFRSWAHTDPRAASQHALRMEIGSDAAGVLSACIRTWTEREPRAAMEWVRQMPLGEQRQNALRAVLNKWANEDPANAATVALTIPDSHERDEALLNVISGGSEQNPQLALELISKISTGSAQNQAISTVLGVLANQDPQAAAEYLATLPSKRQSVYAYAIAMEYARQDLNAALNWASQLSNEELRRRTVLGVVQRWSATDPEAAFQYAVTSGADIPGLLPEVLSAWAQKDASAAIKRAEILTDGKVRDSALSRCISILARTAPQEAIREANKLNSESRRSTLSSIATTWAKDDPVAAANWLIQGTEPALLNALPDVVRNWTRETPAQASEWIQQLPEGKIRDNAISSFVLAVRENAPESAAEWTLTIGDSQMRENAIRDLVMDWRNYDRTAALNWLRQTPGISEQTRQTLLQQSERR